MTPVLCACGCGKPTELAKRTNQIKGHVAGQPLRYRWGHTHHTRRKEVTDFYRKQRRGDGTVDMAHRIKAERALGKRLPKGAEVHHVDSSNWDDSPLVICENHAYHYLLHVRARIVSFSGDPNTQRFCSLCNELRLIPEMSSSPGRCKRCVAASRRTQRLAKKLGVVRITEPVEAF